MHKPLTLTGFNKANDIVTTINTLGGKARLGKTYMDCGAGITWETILVYTKSLDMEYQALSPRDFEELNEGIIPVERIQAIVNNAVRR
jgi:hypothetical protein